MNRLLPVALIGMGMSFVAVAHGGAAAAPEDEGLAGLGDLETSEAGEDGTSNPRDDVTDTLELLRYRLAIIDGSIDEYVDGPTDAWRARVSLHRLA